MKVLYVSVEVSPFAKVGGLADVAGSLPIELKRQGHDVRVVMPFYKLIENDPRWEFGNKIDKIDVRMSRKWKKTASYREVQHRGVPFGFIGTDEWFPLSTSSETVYLPGAMQHLFFSTAVLRTMEKLDWIPDVVHCNDWHTGFLPVIMREKNPHWDRVATVYSIHNLAYQGEFGLEILEALDLPQKLYTSDKLETWGRVNFLKAGMAYSDQVNTVSENYAREIQGPEYGCRLDGLMRYLDENRRLSGILNGIDTNRFDPSTDPEIAAHFDAENPGGKAQCRAALLRELGLPHIPGCPVVGVVSRLSNQKGMDLMLDAAELMFEFPIQLVVLGVGDPYLAAQFRELQARYPDHFRFVERFDVALAQRIYSGCDGFLMPSSFEPCGLGQLIALRYGTVPVVRATGGLADTVFEGENGFVFEKRSVVQMLAALLRMQRAYQDTAQWNRLMMTGLSGDYGWSKSAGLYADMYRQAMKQRNGKAVLQTA